MAGKNKGLILAVIAFFVFCVCVAAGAGAWYYLGKKPSSSPVGGTTPGTPGGASGTTPGTPGGGTTPGTPGGASGTPGSYRETCSTDSNCSSRMICCQGHCGDQSYCDSLCGDGSTFYNGTKTCMTVAAYWRLLDSQRVYGHQVNGTSCSNNDDCESGFCNVFKKPSKCHEPQVGAGEPCQEDYDCDSSNALECRNGRCIRPYSD